MTPGTGNSLNNRRYQPELTVADLCLLLLSSGDNMSMFSSDVALRMLHSLLFWLRKSLVLDQLLTSDSSRSSGRLPSCWGELPMMASGGTVMWWSGTDSSVGGFSSSLLMLCASRLNDGRRSRKLLCRSETSATGIFVHWCMKYVTEYWPADVFLLISWNIHHSNPSWLPVRCYINYYYIIY